MPKGTVKWFNPTKGYGFIQPSTGEKDVFVHISAVERAGLSSLNEGQTVEYELVSNRGKTSAENLEGVLTHREGRSSGPRVISRSPRRYAGGLFLRNHICGTMSAPLLSFAPSITQRPSTIRTRSRATSESASG